MNAQRYHTALAHQRMALGNCPECGDPQAAHSSAVEFWKRPSWPNACDLLPAGVEDRIAQYRRDQATP